MGNATSGHTSDDDDEATYTYHKSVLVEASTPVTGPWINAATAAPSHRPPSHGHLPDTPVSLADQEEFVDAREKVEDEEDDRRGCHVNNDDDDNDANSSSGTLQASDTSGTSLSRSTLSHSGSSESNKSRSSYSSNRSADSYSSPASSSSGSRVELPNRIRVIDTSDSEVEEEEPQTSKVDLKLLTSTHKTNKITGRKTLLRPVPVHSSPSSPEAEAVRGQSQQLKRKANDMDPEEMSDEPRMAIPVKRTGGSNRLFAQRKELREVVLGRNSDTPTGKTAKGVNSSQTSSSEQTVSKRVTQYGTDMDGLEELGASKMEGGESEMHTTFQHSNTSPFKDVHLQTSSSNAVASQEMPHSQSMSAANAGPSTSRAELNANLSQEFDMFERPSGINTVNYAGERPHRVLPQRGNSIPSAGGPSTAHGLGPRQGGTHAMFSGQTAVGGLSPEPSMSDLTTTLVKKGDQFSFLLADVLNVHISYQDVTSFRTDVLINPTDEQLTHRNDDITRSIAEAAGAQMANQCQFFLQQHGGSLAPAEVVETYACGSLSGRIRHVVHLATPRYEAANEKDTNRKLLKSYLNCLNHVNEKLGLRSVVFPIIGTGSYPQDTCINLFFESLLVHLAERTSSNLKSVTFVVGDVHLGNLAIAMVHAHLERIVLEGIDVLMAEALNNYYGSCSSKLECHQNNINNQLEVDTPKKLFRGPPVKRPKL